MSRSCAYRTTDKWHLNMDDSKQLTSKYNTDWIIVIVIMMMVVVVVVMTMTIMQKVVVLIICCIVGEFVAEWWIRNAWSLNCLKAKLNPICHLLSLLDHHIFHVSRIRVKRLFLSKISKTAGKQEEWITTTNNNSNNSQSTTNKMQSFTIYLFL